MSDQASDFQRLLQRARDGDAAAVEQLVREYEDELTRVVKANLGNVLRPYFDSVDLVQSVHKSVLLGLQNDQLALNSPEHLVRLAAVIVRRKIARHWQKHRRQMRLENVQLPPCDQLSLASLVLSASQPSVDPATEVELNERLMRVMDKLELIDRRLIELRLEGCNTAEAARHMNLEPDVLRARLGRVRRRLEASGITADWF